MTSSWQSDVTGAVTGALSEAGDAVNATTTPWRDAVGQGLQAAGSAISGAGSAAVQGLQPAGSALANATVALANATGAVSTISSRSGEMWGDVSSNAISALELGLSGLPAGLPRRGLG